MTMTIPNHPILKDLAHLPIGDMENLSPETMALLQGEANEALQHAKLMKDWLEGVIGLRYADRAQNHRQSIGKDTGTVRFDDDSVAVVADLPKKVVWDQTSLADLVEQIKGDGDDPTEYVDITFKVSERKYNAWPSHIKAAFQEARTVRTGKESFKLILGEDGQ